MTLESSVALNSSELESRSPEIEQAHQAISSACAELADHNEAIGLCIESLETRLSKTQQNLETALDDIDTTDIIAGLDNLTTATAETESQLNEFVQSVQSVVDDFEQACVEAQDTFDGTCGQLQTTLSTIGDRLNALEETLSQAQNETESTFSDLSAAIAQLSSQVGEFQTSVETGFEDCSLVITDTHMSAIDEHLDDFCEQISQTQLTELTSHFTQISDQFTNLYSTFTSDIDGLGDQLQARCHQILEDTGQHCENELKGKLETAFREMIEEAIKELMAEVIENVTLMTAGSSITGALGPILPELVAAKKAAELLNDGLDFVGS